LISNSCLRLVTAGGSHLGGAGATIRCMGRQGHQTFVEELARFAARVADGRLTAIAERAAAPMRVAVRGRRGVGCPTVARALNRAGLSSGISAQLTAPTDAADPDADLVVYVIAEVVKPEDSQAIHAIAAARRPALAVLNKADSAGFAGDGPIALARARCAQFSKLVGVPMEPMIGLLAVAALDDLLDDASWAALRTLADNTNFEVPADVRLRLLDTLDLFGVALAMAAVRQGKTRAQVRALLRRVSGVDAVLDKVAAVGAEVRYRRVLDAVAELEALAVSPDAISGRIGEFCSRDDTVIARMAAAVDLAESAGLEVGPWDDPAAHLSRALRWQRYSLGKLGPVSDVHRACGADIARGSLRLWSRAGGESR
jgi:hypothetical protein